MQCNAMTVLFSGVLNFYTFILSYAVTYIINLSFFIIIIFYRFIIIILKIIQTNHDLCKPFYGYNRLKVNL